MVKRRDVHFAYTPLFVQSRVLSPLFARVHYTSDTIFVKALYVRFEDWCHAKPDSRSNFVAKPQARWTHGRNRSCRKYSWPEPYPIENVLKWHGRLPETVEE